MNEQIEISFGDIFWDTTREFETFRQTFSTGWRHNLVDA